MGLEATLIILDNSKYSLNGDIIPSRLDAQLEACALLAQAKLDENQESTVGLMTMAGRAIEVLLTPIRDIVKIKGVFERIESSGESTFTRAIQIATLCLKHRSEKKLAQRLIVFTASPLEESTKALEELGKKLKKNQIAIEIINLGEPSNEEKLKALVEAAKSGENCRFLNVEPSITPLTDVLSTSGIINKNLDEAANFGGMDGGDDDEMAMAIRISLEEERQRQARANVPAPAPAQPAEGMQVEATAATQQSPVKDAEPTELEKDVIRKAKELSITPKEGEKAVEGKMQDMLDDPEFIKEVLKDLNVDPSSGQGEMLMKQLEEEQAKKEKSKDNKKMDEEK